MKVLKQIVDATALNVATTSICASNPRVSISIDTTLRSFVGTVRIQLRAPGSAIEFLNYATASIGPDPGLDNGVLDYGVIAGEWEIRAIVSAYTSGAGVLTLQVAA